MFLQRTNKMSQAQASPYYVVRYLLGWLLPCLYISVWTQKGLPAEETLKLKWVKTLKKVKYVINECVPLIIGVHAYL